MSGVVPTAPEKSSDEMKNEATLPDLRPDAPLQYNSHFVPGPPGAVVPPPGAMVPPPGAMVPPPGAAVPPPAGYPGGLPMGYYGPQQPNTYPLGQPTSSTSLIQYQPGRYPMPSQPVAVAWMPGPPPMPNCPPGLEYLTQLDNIHVIQHFEPLEMIARFETNNRYDVKNNSGQMVYLVNEDTDDFTRNAYHSLRPFVLRVTDCMGREIMTMQRPCRCSCCCCCCPSARQEMEVQCPPGITLGFVRERWSLCRALYNIQNEKKENKMRVRGPCSTCGCGSDSVFEITSLDGVHIGSIIRKWHGVMTLTTDADHFEIQFPLDLDVKMKAMIFGACFLIDFVHYESAPPQHSSR